MTITGPDARSGAPGQAVVDAALLLLERMGLTPADLLATPTATPPAPTFAEYIPVVSALVSDGCRKAYGSYWNRVTDQWGSRCIDEPTPSEIRQLVQHVRANVVPRRNSRGGRSAAEHLIAALRCMYKHAEEDGLLNPADNPARKVDKPRRLPSTRRAVADKRLAEINHAAATTGLIHDRPLESHGLTRNELVEWWMAINGRLGDPAPAGRTLYMRLCSSLASPPEHLLFKTYCALYGSRGFDIPALIPQVYLHYDPYVRRDFFIQDGQLRRQRMDFLLLLAGRQRVVIEVDGAHHYSGEGRPSPRKYSDMVAEDRALRLAGYEIYRFGGYELAPERGGEAVLTEFFDRFLERHQLGHQP